MPKITIIAAVAENGVIGHNGGMPWRLPVDLARFRELTSGHAMLMGRKTFESFGRVLPGRKHVVVSRSGSVVMPEKGDLSLVSVVNSMSDALAGFAHDERIFAIGGTEIFTLTLPLADAMELTVVHGSPQGDAFFPAVDFSNWNVASERHLSCEEAGSHSVTFRALARKV